MKSSKHKRKRRPSKAGRRQAQRVYKHTVVTQIRAGDLIDRFAGRVEDDFTRGALDLDYRMIARALALGDPETKSGRKDPPKRGMWERYAYQFENQYRRRKFFAEIDRIAKGYLANIVFCQVDAALYRRKIQPPEFIWDDTLLPLGTAPHVLRQWVSDSTTTRKFLTALFRHFADISQKGSIARRALFAANAADKFGWKPGQITKVLVETGDMKLGHHEDHASKKMAFDREASTVGRSLRRMRRADQQQAAQINAERRRQRAADRAAMKQERLLRTARSRLVACLVRRPRHER
jgi:hypothetical protein